MTIKANAGKEFSYYIDTNPDTSGYGIGICPITEKINSDLKIIRKGDVTKKDFLKDELHDLFCCNLSTKYLVNKYYDKDGFVYYNIDDEIYRFYLKIKYLAKIYGKET